MTITLSAPATTEQLLRRRDELPPDHPDRAVLRARVIEENLGMAHRLARRYGGRGERLEDLAQVAALALVKAVDGYDANRQHLFISYAVPSILGALKRHFRDTAWGLRVPRSMQDLVLAVRATSGELNQRLGRPPTAAELAEHLDVQLDHLLAARVATLAYRPASLDTSTVRFDDIGSADLSETIGEVDPRYAALDDHLTLRGLVAALPARERRIVQLRFFDDMSQAQIAVELGVSQMQVSRLLRQILSELHAGLDASSAPTRTRRAAKAPTSPP